MIKLVVQQVLLVSQNLLADNLSQNINQFSIKTNTGFYTGKIMERPIGVNYFLTISDLGRKLDLENSVRIIL